MLKVLCQYENHEGYEKVVLHDEENEDVYRLDLVSLNTTKLQIYETVELIYEDIDFEKSFEMDDVFKKNLVAYVKGKIDGYEELWGENVVDRQILEWLDDDPYYDGGFKNERND